MARSRNIKPSFFTNDVLADNDPLGRLLFIGLWTLADHNGNLEWRAKRVKAQLLPYDNCDVEKLAINLDKSGFIRFYSFGGKTYLNIPTFTDHQNPHKNEREKGSDIPEYTADARQAVDIKGLAINRDKSGLEPERSESDRADSLLLIPDSLNLIPDTCSPESGDSGAGKPASQPRKRKIPDDFQPTDDHRDQAGQMNVSLHDELQKFRDHFKANGKPMADWNAAFRNWLRRASEFKREKSGGKQSETPQQRAERMAKERGIIL